MWLVVTVAPLPLTCRAELFVCTLFTVTREGGSNQQHTQEECGRVAQPCELLEHGCCSLHQARVERGVVCVWMEVEVVTTLFDGGKVQRAQKLKVTLKLSEVMLPVLSLVPFAPPGPP